MRYKNLIGFVWVAVIVSLFTSCLKDINNVYNPGTTAAVVRQHGDSALMMANTRFGWIYATKLSSYSEGKCLLVSFDYDPSLPENTGAEQKGYYTVTIQGETAVNQQNAESPLTDTHKLLTNEQPVLAVNPNDSVLYRAVACAHLHRSIVYTLLVDKPERQSLYSAARRMKVVAPMVTMAPSSMRIRSLSPRISLFRKVPVRLGASRRV